MHHHPDYVGLPILRQLRPESESHATKGKIYKINKYLPELSDSALMNWNGL